jgi:hypothetical protein
MYNDYYVYVFLRCDRPGKFKYGKIVLNYEPFYVGKGRVNRIKTSITTGNVVKKSIIKHLKDNNIKIEAIKIYENLTGEDSLKKENEIINKIGLYTEGGRLCNMTYGGEEASNIMLYKPVCMFDTEGNFLKKFESIEHACSETKLLQPNITKCCIGDRYTTGNKIFKFLSDFNNNIPDKIDTSYLQNRQGCGPKERKVNQYDMNDKFIKTYNSIKEASEETGCQKSKIVLCCQNKRRHTLNFKWKYL